MGFGPENKCRLGWIWGPQRSYQEEVIGPTWQSDVTPKSDKINRNAKSRGPGPQHAKRPPFGFSALY